MAGGGGDAAKSGRHGHGGGQVCQICGDGVGAAADGEPFTACDVCGFPVCRPCYEYERKEGTQACPQCKTKYKRHKGSPPARGDESEDDASDFNYSASGNQDRKHKIPEKMLTWRRNSGASDDIGLAKFDSGEIGLRKYDSGEIPHGYIPRFSHSQTSGEIPGASPDHMMSPAGKRGHPFAYVNHSRMYMYHHDLSCVVCCSCIRCGYALVFFFETVAKVLPHLLNKREESCPVN